MKLMEKVFNEFYKSPLSSHVNAHKQIQEFTRILVHEGLIMTGGNGIELSRYVCIQRNTVSKWLGSTIAKWRLMNACFVDPRKKLLGNEFAANALRKLKGIITHNAMLRHGGNVTKASEEIGITRSTFIVWLQMTAKEWKDLNGYSCV